MYRVNKELNLPIRTAGYHLRKLRAERGFTQVDMGLCIGRSSAWYGKRERDVRLMSDEDIELVADAFLLDPNFVYNGLTKEQAIGFDYLVDVYNSCLGATVEEKLDNFYRELIENSHSFYLEYGWRDLGSEEQELVLEKFKEWHEEHSVKEGE